MKRLKSQRSLACSMALALTFTASPSHAQDDATAAAQANNPLANMKALSFQNYHIGELTETDNEWANQMWVRYAQPFSVGNSDWLFRGSLPVNTFPSTNGGHDSGIGDFTALATYLIDTGNPGISFGIGPQLTAPTATDDELGSEKWSAGFANVMFNATSKKFQYGYLLTWQHSFAGDDDRADVNLAAFQTFLMYQLGGGTYLRSVPIWAYNFENDAYSVPIGLGIGQVWKKGSTVFNAYIEPQVSIADDGPGQPEWQVLMGFNMQFMGGG